MNRSSYSGAVRDSAAERARDLRMLALADQGVAVTAIAQRMGVTVNSVRERIKRARAACASESLLPQVEGCDGADPA